MPDIFSCGLHYNNSLYLKNSGVYVVLIIKYFFSSREAILFSKKCLKT